MLYADNAEMPLNKSVPITITSKALKKGKPDKMALEAMSCMLSTTGPAREKTFILGKTSRDFQRRRFPLEPGCIITDETGSYECTSVSYTNHPKHPILMARQINTESQPRSCAS